MIRPGGVKSRKYRIENKIAACTCPTLLANDFHLIHMLRIVKKADKLTGR